MAFRSGFRVCQLLGRQFPRPPRFFFANRILQVHTTPQECPSLKAAANRATDSEQVCQPTIEERIRLDHENAPRINDFTERTHTCGQLRAADVGRRVQLFGWVSFKRLFFLLLRDGYGVTQVILESDAHKQLVEGLGLESVVRLDGVVRLRPESQVKPDQATGEVEVVAEEITVLNKAGDLPFVPRAYQEKKEALRLRYRYLDLREERMQHNLRLRSKVAHAVRKHLIEQLGFCEVETPTLFRRTPGGAKEFPVACHTYPGQFYSLTQSPQQFKQLLMVGGIDRYFQIARCYRDETARPDRQPEFTQIDLEMSFVQQSDVMQVVEDLIRCVWPKALPPASFPVISHEEAMSKYGTDKPDTRYDLLLEEVADVFPGLIKEGLPALPMDRSTAFMIRWPGGYGRVKTSVVEEWRSEARKLKNCGVSRMSVNEAGEIPASLRRHADLTKLPNVLKPLDLFVLAWGDRRSVQRLLGKVRTDLAKLSGIADTLKPDHQFLWVTDFPLFAKEDGVFSSEHHPFTAPVPEDEALLTTNPEKARGQHFDLVLNGWEVGGGSIRIHKAATQRFVLEDILKEDTSELEHLLQALAMGAPPHGGFALGLDRLLAILCGAPSIRDVIAFPKSSEARDLMAEAPAPLSPEDLAFFHLDKTQEVNPAQASTVAKNA